MPACIWGHLGWVIHTTRSLIESPFHWARWSNMKSRSVTRINWPPINERAYTIKRLLRRPINKGFDRSIIPNHTKPKNQPTKQQSKQSKASKAKQNQAKPSQASKHARKQASKHTRTHARTHATKQPSNQATTQPTNQQGPDSLLLK